jgi:uncharacterized membrane protein HdeD (DUF308 family)
MSTMTTIDPEDRAFLEMQSRGWWIYLVTGSLWLIFGWIVLSARNNITTVWAVAVYAGILFFLFGVGELFAALAVAGWRWLHAILAILGIVAGVIAFAWPSQTFLTLAALIGWFLLVDGTLQIGGALARRHDYDLWWMLLVLGLVEILIAFWAIGYPGRSIVLLIVWVGATALAKGLGQIVGAFALRSDRRELRSSQLA